MKRIFTFIIGFALILATSWSLLHPSFFRVHDYVHATRVVEMLRGLQEGQLPVRWSGNLGYGYGMPLFEFYAPLPFYVGAFLYWLPLNMVTVLKLLYLIANVGTMLGAYLLGKQLFGKAGGWVTAAAYTLAPYRAVNLFVRGALSEAWAMMALPWILFGIVLLIQKKKSGFWVLLFGLVTMMLSHNLTTMIFVPLSLVFALSYFFTYNKKAAKHFFEMFKIFGSYALAVGVSSFYLFPALAEKDYTKIESIFSGYFHYSNHFLYIRQFLTPNWGYGGSSWGPDDGVSFFLGYGQLLGLGLFGLGWLLTAWRRRKKGQLILSATVSALFLFSGFMTLLRSKPLWDTIPLLATIQFPWRWLSLMSLFLAVLAGTAVTFVSVKRYRLMVSTFLIVVMVMGNWNFFRPESYLDDPDSLYYTDEIRIQEQMSQILPDYIPKTMSDPLPPRTQEFLVPAGVENQVEVVVDRAHEKLYKTTFQSPIKFNPMIANFPGWEVKVDGEPFEWRGDGELGTIAFEAPAGERMISVRFGRTPVRAISDTISLLSIVLVFGLATYDSISNKTARRS